MADADIAEKLTLYYAAIRAEQAATSAVMTALEALKTTAGGSTFIHEGQHFQIRKRNEKTYLCELAGPPKGRPKKDKSNAISDASPESAEIAEPTENVV